MPRLDVNAACSGFVFALGVADKFIRSGDCKHVLVIGTETLTRMVDWNDRTTCVLFGDGAGAVVLKADEETGILSTHLHADGSKKELLWNPVGVSSGFKDGANGGGTINMKGNDVSSTPSRRWTRSWTRPWSPTAWTSPTWIG